MPLEPHEFSLLTDIQREIGSLHGRLEAIKETVSDTIRCDDHGKRIKCLETSENKRTGALAVLAMFTGAVSAWLTRKFGG